MGAAYSEEDEAHTTGSSSTISDYYNCYKLLEEVLPQKKNTSQEGINILIFIVKQTSFCFH